MLTRSGVTVEDLACPRDEVLDALPLGLRADPQLEVLGSVVVPDAVEVVGILAGVQGPAEDLGHHDAVLERVPGDLSFGVTGRPYRRVSVLPDSAVTGRRGGLAAAGRVVVVGGAVPVRFVRVVASGLFAPSRRAAGPQRGEFGAATDLFGVGFAQVLRAGWSAALRALTQAGRWGALAVGVAAVRAQRLVPGQGSPAVPGIV